MLLINRWPHWTPSEMENGTTDAGTFKKKYRHPVLFVSHSRDEVYRLCGYGQLYSSGADGSDRTGNKFFRNPKTKTAALFIRM